MSKAVEMDDSDSSILDKESSLLDGYEDLDGVSTSGPPIHEKLATMVDARLSTPMPAEKLNIKLDKYKVKPANTRYLVSTSVNEAMWSSLKKYTKLRDKRLA